MESSKFGIQLKSTGLGDVKELERKKNFPVRKSADKKPENMKDIRNMFESGKDSNENAIKPVGMDYKERSKVKGQTAKSSETNSDDLTLFSNLKFNIDVEKNTTLEKTSTPVKRFNRSDSNRSSLERKKGPSESQNGTSEEQPAQVAKSRVFTASQPLKASVENRLHRRDSEEKGNTVVNKQMATSSLLGNLAILRTRPGSSSSKKTDTVLPSGGQSETTTTSNTYKSGLTGLHRSKSPDTAEKETSSKSPRDPPWVKSGSPSTHSVASRTKSFEKPGDDTLSIRKDPLGTRKSDDGKLSKFTGNLSPRGYEKPSSNPPLDFGLTFTKKSEGSSVSSGSVYSRQSSTDSSTSGRSSPRSSIGMTSSKLQQDKPLNKVDAADGHVSPKIKSISPLQNAKHPPEGSTQDSKPEWMNKSKDLVNKFQGRLKKPEVSGDTRSDANKTANVTLPSTKTDTKLSATQTQGKLSSTWAPKSGAVTNTNDISKTTDRGITNTHSGGKAQISAGQKSQLTNTTKAKLALTTKSKIQRQNSLDDSDSSSSVDVKQKMNASRKMSSEKFQKIKGGFEQEKPESQSSRPKPKVDITTTKNFLERRNSFERPQSPNSNKAKCRTLKSLQEDGKLPKLQDRINALGKGKVEIRTRISSTGSSKSGDTEDREYNDIEGFEVYRPNDKKDDWPTDSEEDDNLYEYIHATDPENVNSLKNSERKKTGGLQNKVPTRRMGQKSTGSFRKDSNRPSFEIDDTHDSSSELTTESSSKEGTLESTEDRTGNEADFEYLSDSSNSGIYEPIHHDVLDGGVQDVASQEEVPPELPPDRVVKGKKKKEKKEGNTIGSKLKKKLTPGQQKQNEPGMVKVSSAPALTGSGSSGLLKKIGKKFMKKIPSNPQTMADEDVGICNSDNDSSDTNPACIYEDEPIQMRPCRADDGSNSDSGSDYLEDHVLLREKKPEAPPRPPPPPPPPVPGPPLPPRHSGPISPPPRTPPEDMKIPALPPRNRISSNVNLDMVVPISSGLPASADLSRGPSWHPSKDSYLHGHQMKTTTDSSSSDDIEYADDYVPPDPAIKKREGLERQSSMPLEPAPPVPPDVVLRDKKKHNDRSSSAYIKFKGNSGGSDESIMEPFTQLLIYKSRFQSEKDEDNIYIDLSDDEQLYGALDRRYTTKFESEPLYQCYHDDRVKKASAKHTVITHSDDESEVSEQDSHEERIYEALEDLDEEPTAPGDQEKKAKLSTLEMFGKTGSVLRALWCEMPEVKESGVLDTITSAERKIQESMFEIITSEASYLKSLNVLINVFLMSPEFSSEHSDRCVITRQERHVLFSNIGAVREASERFLSDLEARWQKSVYMSDICDIIYQHAANKFDCYIMYCSNQTFQERAVQTLQKKQETTEAIKKLERDPMCQGLPMISFLLLPMQRITRLPLLVDAVCHRLDPDSDKHQSAKRAMDALNRVVKKCNDGARRMQQTEQMCLLVQNLEFKVKEIPLVSASRYLVKQGELTRIATEAGSRLPFSRGKPGKQPIYIYLFNDLLVVCKKKGNSTYAVTDYAKRSALHVENIDTTEKAKLLPAGMPSGTKNIFMLVLLENHEQKQVEIIVSCKSPSDRTRWIDALSPSTKETESEKIYEEWDCPQVQCVQKYQATEPDELSLEESDVVNVFKKMTDGWYEGERIRDGERGWFPAINTVEIVNSHVRARNLRLRYRLLLASQQDYGDVTNR